MAKIIVVLYVINIAQTIEENRILLSIVLFFKIHGLLVRFVDEFPTGVLLNVKFYGYRIIMSLLMASFSSLKVDNCFLLRSSYV